MVVYNKYFDSFSYILGCIPDACSPLQTSSTCIITLDLYITVLPCILVYTAVYIIYTALFWVFGGWKFSFQLHAFHILPCTLDEMADLMTKGCLSLYGSIRKCKGKKHIINSERVHTTKQKRQELALGSARTNETQLEIKAIKEAQNQDATELN